MTVARDCAAAGATMIRGGAYKPRSSPYAFQGMGLEGLKLLRAAGDSVGLPVVTEVLDVRDAETVAEWADVLQVGARNMQNFMMLEELGRMRQSGPAQARSLGDHRRDALGRRVRAQGRQPRPHALRARHPHVRDVHAQHARPRGRRRAEVAHAPADHRRSLARDRSARPGLGDGARVGDRGCRRCHGRGAPQPRAREVRRTAVADARRFRRDDGTDRSAAWCSRASIWECSDGVRHDSEHRRRRCRAHRRFVRGGSQAARRRSTGRGHRRRPGGAEVRARARHHR